MANPNPSHPPARAPGFVAGSARATRQPRPYIHRPISGLLGRLRDAIAAEPGRTCAHYAAALNAPCTETGIALRKLVKTGMAIRSGQRNDATFTAGRAPIDNRRTPEQLKAAERARQLRYQAKRREQYAMKVAELAPQRAAERARRQAERDERRALKALVRKHTKPLPVPKPDPAAKQREASDRAWVRAQVAAAEAASPRVERRETVAEWQMRTGNRPEVLRGFVHQPDLRRRGQMHYRQGGAA